MSEFAGFCEIDESVLGDLGYNLMCGSLPDGEKNEIAISDLMLETFKVGGYKAANSEKTEKINTGKDMLGKTITLNGVDYTVSGIVDTKTNISRYEGILEDPERLSQASKLVNFALASEYNNIAQYSVAGLAMTGKGKVQKMIERDPKLAMINNGWIYFINENEKEYISIDANYFARLENVNKDNIVWFDGEKQSLGEKEIIVSYDLLMQAQSFSGAYYTDDKFMTSDDTDSDIDIDAFAKKEYKIEGALPDLSDEYGYNFYTEEGYKIVGYYDNTKEGDSVIRTVICSDNLIEKHTTGTDGIYTHIIGAMPDDRSDIQSVVQGCYENTDDGISFGMNNSVTFELDTVNGVLKSVSKVFFWIGVGFAAFAALMLANFIATSIAYKKQEIGILRAIGSSGSDVFRIFFSESLIIALINFVLSGIGVAAATAIVNYIIRSEAGILITVLHFGVRQIALLLVISIAIAAIASFLPVKRIASKKPIDAIRDR